MFKRFMAIILVIGMMLTMAPVAYTKGNKNNNTNYECITIARSETVNLKAKNPRKILKWQVDINNSWVDIYNAKGSNFKIGYGFAKSILSEHKFCHVRCIDNDKKVDSEYYVDFTDVKKNKTCSAMNDKYIAVSGTRIASSPIRTMKDSTYIKSRNANVKAEKNGEINNSNLENKEYVITVEYRNENNAPIHAPWKRSISKDIQEQTIFFPEIRGYQAYMNCELDNGKWIKGIPKSSISIDVNSLTKDITYVVIYKPGQAKYVINRHYQNLNDTMYTIERETNYGITGTKLDIESIVGNNPGFTAMWESEPTILADGSTVVDIYYDRLYFLMSFDLGEGGRGIEPIYAQYGMPLNVGIPERRGHTFVKWQDSKNGKDVIISTMPAYNCVYKAIWEEMKTAKIRINVYLNNPNTNENELYDHISLEKEVGKTISEKDIFYCNCTDHKTTHEGEEHTPFCYREKDVPINSRRIIDTLEKENANKTEGTIGKYGIGKLAVYFVYHNTNIPGETSYKTGWYRFSLEGYLNNDSHLRKCSEHNKNCYVVPDGMRPDFDYSLMVLKKDDQVKVKADGTSVINLYYERKQFTLHFRNSNISGLASPDIAEDEFGTIKEPWGKNIEKEFIAINKNANTTRWSEKYNRQEPWTTVISEMPKSNKIFYKKDIGIEIDTKAAEYRVLKIGGNPKNINDYELKQTVVIENNREIYVTKEDIIEFPGYKLHEESANDPVKSSKIGDNFRGAVFYYERIKYELNFNIVEGVPNQKRYVEYQELINTVEIKKQDMDSKFYPNDIFEKGEKTFIGWYVDKECSIPVDWSNQRMASSNMEVFAKWEDMTYTVESYLDKNDMENNILYRKYDNCKFGTLLTNLEHPNRNSPDGTTKNLIFAGWFYINDSGREVAFDNFKMPIKSNLKLYAKWIERVMVKCTIHYALKGTDTEIADPIVLKIMAKTNRTFYPKAGIELSDGYKLNYYPTETSKTVEMNIDPNVMNEVWFYYEYRGDKLEYTVRYLENKTNKKLSKDEKFMTNQSSVYVNFKEIKNYVPDMYSKKLVLSTNNDENIITFYYTKSSQKAPLKFVTYIENLDGTYSEYTAQELIGDIGQEYIIDKINIPGYEFDEKNSANFVKGRLDSGGLILKRYYNRIAYTYKIRYLDFDTQDEIATCETGKLKFGHSKVFNEKIIEGWKCINPRAQEMTIKVEENPEIAVENVYTYFYRKSDQFVDLHINKAGTQMGSNDDFIFHIKGMNQSTAEVDITVVIHGNETLIIKDVPKGTYRISSDSNWNWRYSCTPQTLNVKNSMNVVMKCNKVKNLWLNGVDYVKNLWK